MTEERRLLGRADEQRALTALVTAARNGISGALVLRGDPGIGKTVLLQHLVGRVNDAEVISLVGYEAESTIPFSGLHRIVSALEPDLKALPERHQQAIGIAVGAQDGPPPDRFLVGLGLLGLLAEASQHQPVVCVVDEAHWLDSESLEVLAFVGRRLHAEPVALVIALRDDPGLDVRVAGLPELRLAGLDLETSVRLLTSSLDAPLDPLAAAQIARATGGNPLALVDLADELSVKQLTDSSLADEPIPVGHHLEAHYARQVRAMAAPTRAWLLVVAADSTGSLDLVTRTARRLGLVTGAGDEAEAAGLVTLTDPVTFRHPLVRSAVYGAATGPERRRVHRALSTAAAELDLEDRAAWHAAKAAIGTDPTVADGLERVADRAGRRGGFASRASVLARAAELTPAGPARNGRLVAAAEAALAAGAAQIAGTLLDGLDDRALDPTQRSRATTVQAAVALFTPDPALVRGGARMVAAADAVHGVDPELEQTALLRAFEYCLPSERLTSGLTLAELGHRLAAGAEVRDGSAAIVLRALSAHILGPYAEAVPLMRAAVDELLRLDDDQERLRFGTVSVALTTALWDNRGRTAGLLRSAAIARDAGSLHLLDIALWTLSLTELTGGTPRRAGEYIEQVRELRRAIGYPAEHVVNAAYLAWVGAPRPQVEGLATAMGQLGFGGVESAAVAALAIRDLAEGRYADAYERLEPLVDEPFLQATPTQYPDFVEAAVRSGHTDRARPVLQRLTAIAEASGSPWAAGVTARSRALLEPPATAEPCYRSAIDALTEAGTEVDLARAELLYGEWLRRRRRRRDARVHLGRALDVFEQSGAPAFAERARAELVSSGMEPAARPTEISDLTPREATVARLAAQGHTNAEIGATLFISGNTVDYHLRKVFAKLGISSRRQLAERLGPRSTSE